MPKSFCNFKGCLNTATVIGHMKEFTNDDGLSKWKVYVNVCDEHFDSLIMKQYIIDEEEKRKFTLRIS